MAKQIPTSLCAHYSRSLRDIFIFLSPLFFSTITTRDVLLSLFTGLKLRKMKLNEKVFKLNSTGKPEGGGNRGGREINTEKGSRLYKKKECRARERDTSLRKSRH